MDNKELLISTITNVNKEISYFTSRSIINNNGLDEKVLFALKFQIDDISLNCLFPLGNYLFKNSLVAEAVIENIIEESINRKGKIFAKDKPNKDFKIFLDNLPTEIKLRLELEK